MQLHIHLTFVFRFFKIIAWWFLLQVDLLEIVILSHLLGCLILIFFVAKIVFILQCILPLARYNESNDLSTFLCLPNNTICQALQNTLVSHSNSLCDSKVYHTTISWGLETNNSRWGARSGEYNGCESDSTPNSCFFACEMFDVWDGALSSWRRIVSSSNVTVSIQ